MEKSSTDVENRPAESAGEGVELKTDWQPIATAPKDGTWVLAVVNGLHPLTKLPFAPAVVSWAEEYNTWVMDCSDEPTEHWGLTHWMPLPPLPSTLTGASQ